MDVLSSGSEQYMLKKLLSVVKLALTEKIQMISQRGACAAELFFVKVFSFF